MVINILYNKRSFVNAKKWIKQLKRYANENILIALIGNKSDQYLKRNFNGVSWEEAFEYAAEKE